MLPYERIHPFSHSVMADHALKSLKEAIREDYDSVVNNVEAGHRAAFYIAKALYELCAPKLREGRKYLGDETSWIDWKVMDPNAPEALAIESEMSQDDDYGAVHIHSPYDCTGKVFSGPIRVKKSRTRFLVTRYSGIDI